MTDLVYCNLLQVNGELAVRNGYLTKVFGFTLIELIIVIIVVSILSVSAFQSFSNPSNMLVNPQADQVMNDIRYAQALSMTQNVRYCFVGTSSNNGASFNAYQIVNSSTGVALTLSKGQTITLPGKIVFSAISPTAYMFVFDGLGTPYYSTQSVCNATNANAATLLSTVAKVTLSNGSQSAVVTMYPETGSLYTQ